MIEEGLLTYQAAARSSIGILAAVGWARLKRSQGDVRPGWQGKPKSSVFDAHADFIPGVLEGKPDTTLDELVDRLAAARGRASRP